MRWLSLSVLVAAAIFSAVVVVPFLPIAKIQSGQFAMEVTAASNAAGVIQVYYDIGEGLSEERSSRLALPKTDTPVSLRLNLPAGTIRGFRLDPIDTEGTVILSRIQILGVNDRVIHDFNLDRITAANQIASLRRTAAGLEVKTITGASDPQLALPVETPITIGATTLELLNGFWPRAIAVFAGLLLITAIAVINNPVSRKLRLWMERANASPARAIWIIAGIAAVTSAYPVIFLGDSYVSPNFGTKLLYDAFPTLPGYSDPNIADVKGSDVGAVIWQHVPFSMIQHRALRAGELPVWNRYSAGGVPLLGQGQSMFGDPLELIVIAADGAAWAWDAKFLVAKWLFAAGLGLLVFEFVSRQPSAQGAETGASRGNSIGLWSALLVTIAAPFIGFFVYRVNHPAFFSLCYSPWALYCWVRIVRAETRGSSALWIAALIVANVALMNSGTVKEAYMLLLCLNISGAGILLTTNAPWRVRLLKFAALGWAGLLFALLTAPIWATFLHDLRHAYTSYNVVNSFQIQPAMFLGLFDETFYRTLTAWQKTFNPSLNFLLFGGLLYFAATLRASFDHRAVMALAATSLLPLALVFGGIPPSWVMQVPFFGNIAHLDNTFSCVLIVQWSVLAGVGFSRAFERLGTRDARGDLVLCALVLGAIVIGWVGFGHAVHRAVFGLGSTFTVLAPGQSLSFPPFICGYLMTLVAALIVLAWVGRRSAIAGKLSTASAIWAALAIVVLLWRQGLHANSFGFEAYAIHPTLRVDLHARSDAMAFVEAAVAKEPARGIGLEDNFFPGWTAVYGLETVHGPDALTNPYWRELTGSLPGVTRIWDWRLIMDANDVAKAHRYLDVLNVRYYFDLHRDQAVLAKTLRRARSADLDVYESSTAWPRAFFSDHVVAYDHISDLVRLIADGDGAPFAALQRSDEFTMNSTATLPHARIGDAATAAVNYHLTENTTSFDVSASAAGVIVVNQAYWPGDFRAALNGRKVPILRLNHAFVGILVPRSGSYHVEIRAVPAGFPRNLMLSGTGFLLLGASLILVIRRKPANTITASRRLETMPTGA